MCFCCRTPEESFARGSTLLTFVHSGVYLESSHISRKQISELITALKALMESADQDNPTACFFVGRTIWLCNRQDVAERIEDAFRERIVLRQWECVASEKYPIALDYRRALALKYLMQAAYLQQPDAQNILNEVERYAESEFNKKPPLYQSY